MKKYIIIVEHDNGKTKFIVPATSLQKAKEIVMTSENCPPRAIVAAYPKPKEPRRT
jgi:hypothetical protein